MRPRRRAARRPRAVGFGDDAAGDAAEHHRTKRPIAARAADEQIEVARQVDQDVGGLADERFDLDRAVVAELGDDGTQRRFRLDPRLSLDGREVDGRNGSPCAVPSWRRARTAGRRSLPSGSLRRGVPARRRAQRLPRLVAVRIGHRDRADHRARSRRAERSVTGQARLGGGAPPSSRARLVPAVPRRLEPTRAARVLRLGRLVQRAGRAGALELAALRADAGCRQLALQLCEAPACSRDEVVVGRPEHGRDAADAGTDRQERRARLHGGADQRRAKEPGGGDGEARPARGRTSSGRSRRGSVWSWPWPIGHVALRSSEAA